MSDEIKLTAAQRAAAQERIRDNLALCSGAGCGKTLVLAHRFTELLLASGAAENPLSRFVALTFTDKAALEMRQRTQRFLAAMAAGSKGDSRRKLLGWLEELPGARISTIHSFCAGLLRANAIEAGIDPDFAVCADEILTDTLLDDAADEAVLSAVERQRRDVSALLTGMTFDQLVAFVRQLVSRRTDWKAQDYADPAATLARWKKQIAHARRRAYEHLASDKNLRRRIDELQAAPCAEAGDKLLVFRNDLLKAVRRLLDDAQAPNKADFDTITNFRPGGVGSDKAWGGRKGAAKDLRDALKALAARFEKYAHFAEEPGDADKAAAEALATITGLAREADDIYAAAKRRGGILDFDDLLALAHRLLSSNPAVRKAAYGQIDQLLIDECQDTNAFQVDLLSMLAWGGSDRQAPPAGRLFVVGDKKQSIYRFRGAQVEVFDDLCRRLGPRNQESLDVSFRTHAAGVAFVNELFAPLMGGDYSAIRASREELPPHPSVEIILAHSAEGRPIENAGDAAGAQAAAAAQRISEILAAGERLVWDAGAKEWRPAQRRDVAVLFARMTNSLAYEQQLAARGIGYYVVAGTGFFRRHEVFDVLNALRAIDNPFDDVAFFGVLRSGMFALDDEALLHIAEAVARPYLASLAGKPGMPVPGLGEAQGQVLHFAVDLLSSLRCHKDAVGIDATIEQLLAATGYEATLLAQFNGRQMLGNVRRLVELARAASADGTAIGGFLAQMNERIIDQSRFEQAAVAGEASDVVRLMTIHKAKGLEFPIVFVPDLNFAHMGVRESLLNRLDMGLTVNLKAPEDNQSDEQGESIAAGGPISFRVAKALEEEDQRREDIRKLYVAATRHCDHLVFIAADWRSAEGTFRNSGSYISAMDAQLGIAAAADAGRNISYAGGQFEASVRRLAASPAPPWRHRRSRGRQILERSSSAREFAGAIVRQAPPASTSLLGPIGREIGQVELGATALAEFEHCPMLYRWQQELRVPVVAAAGRNGRSAKAPTSLDAATLGTLLHRCMELLDFHAPQAARALVPQAAAEMSIDEGPDLDAVADELDGMLAAFRRQPLWHRLAGARNLHRELQFLLRVGPATIAGQIDMLYEDAEGAWHIVDYKSDRIAGDAVSRCAGRYELQMFVYAAAAARHLARPPDDAVVYFLRPAAEHKFELAGDAIAACPPETAGRRACEPRIEKVAAELIAARRSGVFKRNQSGACGLCPYGRLCQRNSSPEGSF